VNNQRLLKAGRNCWRIERADRLAVLIDAAAYFGALRASLLRARHAIRIVGWDVDSRVEILADPAAVGHGDAMPRTLGDLLNALVARNRGLRAYVLDWDFPMLYAPDREALPVYALGWRTHRRVSFCLAGDHPVGASHHQKLVVVDDAVAFAGGIDLTLKRWDTPAHAVGDARRREPDGTRYPPFHDVQMALDGAAAAALGELARTRWQRATGRPPRSTSPEPGADAVPWPAHLTADFEHVDVAISRTEAAYDGRPHIDEIRHLYVDAVSAARRWLYIENQYLSSSVIADAIAERLQADDAPEIVIVTRRTFGGWLEEASMSVLRARVLARLRECDRHDRLRVYYPDAHGLHDQSIIVHSKVLVADERLLIVGSANLSNRSLVLDTECCVALEADDSERGMALSSGIAEVRDCLLAEHLGVDRDAVAAALEQRGSLIGAVESLLGRSRTLRPLDPQVPAELDELVPEAVLVDPEKPVGLDQLADELVPDDGRPSIRRRALLLAGFVIVVAAAAAAWRFTPLSDLIEVRTLVDTASVLAQSPLAPLWVLLAYGVAAVTAVPVTLMIVLTTLVFGAWPAFFYALAGSLGAAALTFGIGHVLGRDLVSRLGGDRLNRLNRRLGRSGLLAVATVRILPLAPFTVVNLAAGASHVRLRDFLLGTALGMLPGIAAITVFSDRVLAVLREPSATALALLLMVAAAVAAGAYALNRWLGRRENASKRR